MKDLGEASYILGIKLLRDRKNKILTLSQAVYIGKVLGRFSMENFKTGLLPFIYGITFAKDQSLKTSEKDRENETSSLCRSHGKSHVCHTLYYARHLFCGRDG